MLQFSIDSHASLDRQEENETKRWRCISTTVTLTARIIKLTKGTCCAVPESPVLTESDLLGRLDSAKFSLQINELFEVLLTGDRIETSTLYIVTANIYYFKMN